MVLEMPTCQTITRLAVHSATRGSHFNDEVQGNVNCLKYKQLC